jgi:hypothetical protein
MGVILPSVPPDDVLADDVLADDVLADDVLAKYIEAAMEDATFVIFVEDETCYGDIYGFPSMASRKYGPTLIPLKSAVVNSPKSWKIG